MKGQRIRGNRGSSSRAAAGALRVANTIGAAMTNRRLLGPAEAKIMASAGLVLLAIAFVCTIWPLLVTIPLAVVTGWIATTLFVKAWRLRRSGRKLASDGFKGN